MAANALDGYALVIGSGGGIGLEAAYTLAESGVSGIAFATLTYTKACAGRDASHSLATHPSYRSIALEVDIRSSASVAKMVSAAVAEFGRIDYCVCAAGIDTERFVPFAEVREADFDRVQETNSKGMWLVTQALVRQMVTQPERMVQTSPRHPARSVGRGAIVHVMSANSHGAIPNRASYITSRHASLGMLRAAALDHAAQGVRINAVCPVWVRTPLFDEEVRQRPEIMEVIKAVVPAGRPVDPIECAETIRYLLSPQASFIHGIALMQDAGTTLTVRMYG